MGLCALLLGGALRLSCGAARAMSVWGQCTTNFFFLFLLKRGGQKFSLFRLASPEYPNEGWGDCLFWSLSQGIQHTGGGSHHHRSVRAVLGWRRGCRDTNLCTSTSLWKKQKMDGKKRGGDARTAMPMIKSWPRKVGSWAGNLDSCTCYHSLQANLTHLWIWTEQEI